MIRDILILGEGGVTLFSANFGECHSFGENVDLFSSFINALQIFSKNLNYDQIETIKMRTNYMSFHKTDRALYTIVYDLNDNIEEMNVKIRKISEIFENEFAEYLDDFKGEVTPFLRFKDILLDLKITQKNCGGRPECNGCENATKTLDLSNFIEEVNKKASFLSKLKGVFKKNKR
ncbi:MAG: hypothetical protein ACTSRZ_21450 [Promethearchaeota archaeon]